MSFWAVHGYIGGFFFILFLLLLPRLTMFLSLALAVGMVTWLTEPLGLAGHPLGILIALAGWVAWFMLPRFLIAILATALYFETNAVLVVGAWLSACFIFISKKEIAEESARKRQEEAARVATEEETATEKKRARTSGTQSDQQRRRRPAQSASQRAQQWWDVLGVNPGASAHAIKAAYRRVAKATHPDSAPDGKGDVETFRKANEAYQQGLKKNGK